MYDHLRARIESAVQFTKRYPAALRPTILQYVLGTPGAIAHGRAAVDRPPTSVESATLEGMSDPPVMTEDGSENRVLVAPADREVLYARMAAVARLPVADVRRCIELQSDLTPDIRIILQEESIAQRQIEYSVLYLWAKDQTGRQGATSRELQALCKAKKSFNSPNFTRNFKTSRFLQAYGKPGTAAQEWVLTTEGRERALQVLNRLLAQP